MKAYTESGAMITIDDRYEIKRGGEGKILTIPELPDQVAKIYLSANYQHMSQAQKNALACLDTNLFVKPLELIYRKKGGDIMGFTMQYLLPEYVPLAAFYSKNYGATAGVAADFKFNIAAKIIAGVQSAHAQGVIIGDLSGLNILVSAQAGVKFIDTDSYETAVHTHWGVLLDEIRDYFYQGKVSKESDYFALAVVLFNLFTHLHPFKGVHKLIKSMAERMINRLPVFAQDNDLILPKCYEPLQNKALQAQFDDIFLVGKRFLLQLTPTLITTPTTPTIATPIAQLNTTLKYKEVYVLQAGEAFRKAYFTQHKGYVQTTNQMLLYDASNQGYLTPLYTFAHEDNVQYFVGNKNLLRQHQNTLEVWQGGQQWLALKNVNLSPSARLYQMQDILTVLEGDFMRLLYIDDIIQDQIRINQTPVFTAGFDTLYGLVQNVGGAQYVWHHSGKTLSTIKTAIPLQNALISGHTGLAIYETDLHGEIGICYEYFTLQGMHMKMSGEKINGLRNFATKTINAQTSLLFEPADDKIIVRNAESAQVLQEMVCSLITTETALQMTHAGIIAFEKDFCYLLNT